LKIYKVEIVFENCNTLTVPGKYIFTIRCKNISTSLENISYYNLGEVQEYKHIEDFTVGILSDAENDKETKLHFDEFDGKLNRLNGEDITGVNVITWDGTNWNTIKYNDCYVPWIGDDECINQGNVVYKNELGDYLINVSKESSENKEHVFKYFDKDLCFYRKEFMNRYHEKINENN